MIDTQGRRYVQRPFDVAARFFKMINLHPNVITVLAFLLGIGSFVMLWQGKNIHALVFLWLSGAFDVLDGTVARLTGKSSKIGAYLDMIFDRLVECFVILGFYLFMPQFTLSYFIFLIGMVYNFTTFMLAGTLFENKGYKSMHYDVGIVERTECFIFFSVMMILPQSIPFVLNIFNALMILTGTIRIIKVIRFEMSSNHQP